MRTSTATKPATTSATPATKAGAPAAASEATAAAAASAAAAEAAPASRRPHASKSAVRPCLACPMTLHTTDLPRKRHSRRQHLRGARRGLKRSPVNVSCWVTAAMQYLRETSERAVS